MVVTSSQCSEMFNDPNFAGSMRLALCIKRFIGTERCTFLLMPPKLQEISFTESTDWNGEWSFASVVIPSHATCFTLSDLECHRICVDWRTRPDATCQLGEHNNVESWLGNWRKAIGVFGRGYAYTESRLKQSKWTNRLRPICIPLVLLIVQRTKAHSWLFKNSCFPVSK